METINIYEAMQNLNLSYRYIDFHFVRGGSVISDQKYRSLRWAPILKNIEKLPTTLLFYEESVSL